MPSWTSVLKLLVVIHVTAGVVAFVAMMLALSFSKGGRRHRQAGMTYTRAMVVALVLALFISAATLNFFLFSIGVFSGYFVYTGWRLAVARNGVRVRSDHWAAVAMCVCAISMIAFGGVQLLRGDSIGLVLILFGTFGGLPAVGDCKRGQTWPRGKERIVLHLGRMGGASIATITAAFVTNIQTDPAFIAWLLPTSIGTPLIVYWTRKVLGGKVKSGRRLTKR